MRKPRGRATTPPVRSTVARPGSGGGRAVGVAPPDRSIRDRRLALLAVALAWALLFLPHLLMGQRVVFADASYYRPFAEFSRARWHASHERTYWNPYVFMGIETVASLADPRPQYLPDPLLDLAERLGNPARSPQLWLLLAHLGGTLAMFALSRRLWGADPWSAAAGALAWLMAVPILGPFAHGFDAQLLADAAIPALLLCTHVLFEATAVHTIALAALSLSLALGIQCLHGHPQILVYSSMLVALFAAQQAWQRRRPGRLLPWAGAVALGAAIGAAVWWPATLYGLASSRTGHGGAGVPMAVVAKYSYQWRDLVSLVWAQAVGYGRSTYWGGLQLADDSPYLGAAAAALAVAGFRRSPGEAGVRFWRCVFAASVVLALGATLGPVFEAIHRVIPFWSGFRVVHYVLIGATVAFSLLVARGTARALAAAEPVRPPSLGPPLAALAALGALGLAIAVGPLRPAYIAIAQTSRPQIGDAAAAAAATWAGFDLLALAALVAAVWILLARARGGGLAPRVLIVALVALDLGAVVSPNLWRSRGAPGNTPGCCAPR